MTDSAPESAPPTDPDEAPALAALRQESDEWPYAVHWSVFWTSNGDGEIDREPCDCTIGEDHKREAS